MNPKIKKGSVFYMHQDSKFERWPYKYHIVNVLPNEKDPQIIYKYYGKHKQWWHYKIESLYIFKVMLQNNLYSFKKYKKV